MARRQRRVKAQSIAGVMTSAVFSDIESGYNARPKTAPADEFYVV